MKIEFAWNDETHLLQLLEMDATHREFVDLLLRAQRAPDGELAQCLDALLDHSHGSAPGAKAKPHMHFRPKT